jgi:hypothetical protein
MRKAVKAAFLRYLDQPDRIIFYSERNDLTGLASAALIA